VTAAALEVVPLVDAVGSFATFRQAFGIDDDAPWELTFHAYLVRHADAVVLVDTGVGPPGGDEPFLPERQGRLPAELERAGVAPGDVDLVVLTHLHPDHVGWNMVDGAPFFPNARYVAHRADFEWITGARPDRPYVRDNVVALERTGALELVDGPAEPLPGMQLIRTGGHTPGHCLVDLGDATIVGDLAVHELQLADPSLGYVAEEDRDAIAAARARLLPGFATAGRLVAFGHLGCGRVVVRPAGGFAWQPVD
jgi:glyoxylase-like metal-dependent hydrolase (beta-lactamase superfamily II)